MKTDAGQRDAMPAASSAASLMQLFIATPRYKFPTRSIPGSVVRHEAPPMADHVLGNPERMPEAQTRRGGRSIPVDLCKSPRMIEISSSSRAVGPNPDP